MMNIPPACEMPCHTYYVFNTLHSNTNSHKHSLNIEFIEYTEYIHSNKYGLIIMLAPVCRYLIYNLMMFNVFERHALGILIE